ncbi:MAG: rcp1 2 [Flavipsychrobacter sp.]|jgi:CheY-like chemotaxis protein|nr:rcp1 2 [Flavipsychrobacter sp.]
MEKINSLRLLLAEDDSDDCLFFAMTLSDLPFTTHLETVPNGKKLMAYLSDVATLPDVLFLDLNMPLKNGIECLTEIKQNKKLMQLPIIIYSTSLHYNVADQVYQMGADYYIRKSNLPELTRVLQIVFTQITEKKFDRPSRDNFILSPVDGT